MKIIHAKDYNDLSRKAANIISAQVILKPESVLGLATGSSPLGIYRQLIIWYEKGDLDFSATTAVNLDEYCNLPPDNPQSYHAFMRQNFFDHININPARVHIPNGMASDLETECRRYDQLSNPWAESTCSCLESAAMLTLDLTGRTAAFPNIRTR